MSNIETRNARITKTTLGFEDHGILTAYVHLDYGGSGQGAGGYNLTGPAMAFFVRRVIEAIGVRQWEDLPGKHCRVQSDFGQVYAIGDIIDDRWFYIVDEMLDFTRSQA